MKENVITREQEVIEKLKREYTQRGYSFVENPDERQVPDFLSKTRPDAIATKGQEQIAFEVLLTGKSAKSSATANFLAREIPKHPGWKFELVVVDSAIGGDDASFDLQAKDFDSELQKVIHLAKNNDFKLSVVAGWALLESLKRFLTSLPENTDSKRYRPSTVVESLVSEGLVEDEEGEMLRDISQLRNRLVHGFVNVEVKPKDAENLIETLKNLVGLTKNER